MNPSNQSFSASSAPSTPSGSISQQNPQIFYWWVPDDLNVWVLAKQDGSELPNGCANFIVLKTNQRVLHPLSICLRTENHDPSQDLTANAPEDLVYLPDVNEGSILNSTRLRFAQKKIYTSCGSVLMSINPFGSIPNLYGKNVIRSYLLQREKLPTHLYEIPSRAYQNMTINSKNQTIFFSGEVRSLLS